jgi:V/A-type H+-transporting ATPase subunit B
VNGDAAANADAARPVPAADGRAAEDGFRLFAPEYRTVSYASGPLLFVERVAGVGIGEVVEVLAPGGELRRGQVLEVARGRAVVQVFAGTRDLDLERTTVRFSGLSAPRLGVGIDLLGRVLDGSGEPLDGGPPPIPETQRDVNGLPINPAARDHPSEFVETGISAIDGLNTLVRGQKLPIFSGFGLPAAELVAQVVAGARVGAEAAGGAVVFAAVGITHREAGYFRRRFEANGALDHTVLFLNLADDPAVERLLVPRAALAAAEFLAFDRGMHVLVILADMTNYCEALREVATAREEVPGRRGYPGYMYTDLAAIYERAGRIRGREGSITQLVILSMPDDDITHPIPDLTGYITEGQIVLSRDLQRRGIFPPIDVLPSLSRLMNAGIGTGKTREDHRAVADQLYELYARGRDLRRLVAIIGASSLSAEDRRVLVFADRFEQQFVHQGDQARPIGETLDLAWRLLEPFSDAELRVSPELRRRYVPAP